MTLIAALLFVFVQDGQTLLTDAVDKLREAEGVAFKGAIGDVGEKQEQPGGMGIRIGGWGNMGIYEGDFEARIGGEETVVKAVDEKNHSAIELFKKGDRVVKRVAWVQGWVNADAFEGGVLPVLNLEQLSEAVSRGEFEELEEDGEEQVVKGTLPGDYFKTPEPEEGGNQDAGRRWMRQNVELKVESVEVVARLDAESGELKSLAITVVRSLDLSGLQNGIMRWMGGGEGGEEAPPEGMGGDWKQEFKTEVKLTVEGTGEDFKPSIPEELDKLFEE